MLMRIVYSLAPILSEIIILFKIESKLIFDILRAFILKLI